MFVRNTQLQFKKTKNVNCGYFFVNRRKREGFKYTKNCFFGHTKKILRHFCTLSEIFSQQIFRKTHKSAHTCTFILTFTSAAIFLN